MRASSIRVGRVTFLVRKQGEWEGWYLGRDTFPVFRIVLERTEKRQSDREYRENPIKWVSYIRDESGEWDCISHYGEHTLREAIDFCIEAEELRKKT